ncbi:MAG: N(2)-fixation sustaining protein CowN [Trichlorobacter sp.]|uniref:N(2)-fixation sustaining protein CowN n=1 Tax=Trichlorobacter sp. TaxID=2911007 RepID=UPI0025646D56|nr:N(2)-fixation sustaining protein CowN [Trichlorobacter sp.]MDK9717227.1 N(2)-fixation sustaining protein CowN [Trichlorobacter sp.]
MSKPDRYVSFVGIDGDSNARKLMELLCHHIDDPAKTNRFWELFKGKLERIKQPDATSGFSQDELYLIHAYINNIRELFETYDDRPAQELLDRIEAESC